MGRHRQYNSAEELQEVIDDYFFLCSQTEEHPTITGLALAINLVRQSLLNYEGDPEFMDTIKRAKARVEHAVEKTLLSGKSPAGAIFNLKNNFKWVDENTQNIRGEIGVRSATVNFE